MVFMLIVASHLLTIQPQRCPLSAKSGQLAIQLPTRSTIVDLISHLITSSC